ncbi:hypothetical protein N8621_03470 [Akkermansiaceae bacterium]|nr:hypothetical protein [Akkermansiaceae bacterium]MDB4501704.1 hypothetical protein [Akkermansiaceae bacterium]MDB4548411.1 hypothetical protein [Akkermansiaceae bacterium]MDB4784488.1 hypothetical protein [Akkermansiaceae bacterium]
MNSTQFRSSRPFRQKQIPSSLDKNGHALCPRGGKLFQTGLNSLFGKDTPVLKYPLGLE